VERCTGSSCSDFAFIATSTTNSYESTGLTASTTYRFRVLAFDDADNYSGYSNIATETTDNFILLQGHISSNRTLTEPVYLVRGEVTVDSGVTLKINPSIILKFESATSSMTVNGALTATTTQLEDRTYDLVDRIYFTSNQINPSAGDWGSITTNSGATTTLENVFVGYGGNDDTAMLNNNGGSLTIHSSTIATSTKYNIYQSDGQIMVRETDITGAENGLYVTGGTNIIPDLAPVTVVASDIYNNSLVGIYTEITTLIDFCDVHDSVRGIDGEGDSDVKVSSSRIFDNTYGIWFGSSGSGYISANSIHDNTLYGITATSSSASTTATFNYWGASDGPGGEGTGSGDWVSTNVNFDDYLIEAHYIQVSEETGTKISSVKNKRIYWRNTANFASSTLISSVDTWNNIDEKKITWEYASSSDIDLDTEYENRPDKISYGQWNYYPNSDIITINHYMFDGLSDTEKQHTITHELGHALGLAHSYVGNLMYYELRPTTAIGEQDNWDYQYLWNN
jgi:hypothetical protein